MKVQDSDSIVITLPADTTARWDTNLDPTCEVFTGASILACEILSNKIARVTLTAQSNLLISGTISIFKNPFSTREIRSIVAELQERRGTLKVRSS